MNLLAMSVIDLNCNREEAHERMNLLIEFIDLAVLHEDEVSAATLNQEYNEQENMIREIDAALSIKNKQDA